MSRPLLYSRLRGAFLNNALSGWSLLPSDSSRFLLHLIMYVEHRGTYINPINTVMIVHIASTQILAGYACVASG